MKYDTVIIGGGLAGLVCGVRLQRAGRRCTIISSGQNAMHFSSGSFGLLYRNEDGSKVDEPLKAISALDGTHPYKKIGTEKVASYAGELKDFFESCGITLSGDPSVNSCMISPVGIAKPAWMALEDVNLLPSAEVVSGHNVLVVNLKGYLDFNSSMIASGLEKNGAKCRLVDIDNEYLDRLRVNPSEMRSVNIARAMDNADVRNAFIMAVNSARKSEDTVVLPSVFGLWNPSAMREVREGINAKVVFVGTMPPSVPGIRSQMLLKKAFEDAGGTFLLGDEVVEVRTSGERVESVLTSNLGTTEIEASEFVLATGSFFSKGLWSTPYEITEPLLGLDVTGPESRADWHDKDFFGKQNYLGCGVLTDETFRPLRNGLVMENIYAIGSVLGGFNPVELGCGAGVALMTAMAVSDKILEA